MTEDAKQILTLARNMLERAEPATAGLWPRATAVLGRQALEAALDAFWRDRAPQVAECSTRAQLLCLTSFLDESMAEQASHVWWALSRACHHHAFELAPTYVELGRWITSVGELSERLAHSRRSN